MLFDIHKFPKIILFTLDKNHDIIKQTKVNYIKIKAIIEKSLFHIIKI